MWTREHRTIDGQSGERLPTDLTDAQWAHLEPLIPPADPGGRPRKTDMRAAMNAIFYLLRTGCPWRYLPCDSFPPRSTVYNIFRKFPTRWRLRGDLGRTAYRAARANGPGGQPPRRGSRQP